MFRYAIATVPDLIGAALEGLPYFGVRITFRLVVLVVAVAAADAVVEPLEPPEEPHPAAASRRAAPAHAMTTTLIAEIVAAPLGGARSWDAAALSSVRSATRRTLGRLL